MRRLLIALISLGAIACTPTSQPAMSGAVQEQVASLWTAETRTVLPADTARMLSRQCSRVSPGPIEDTWTPSQAEIQTMEDGLILLLAQKLEERCESPSPGDYYRQIAGFVIGGRRVIYVNGVHRGAVEDSPVVTPRDLRRTWRDYPIQICDGGSVTFGVEYDPATRQFSNFAFNGAL